MATWASAVREVSYLDLPYAAPRLKMCIGSLAGEGTTEQRNR